jgi:uncharacterized membrane protein YidH (DUF202 family)
VAGGLQQERTALAWRRTTLSLVVVGVVTMRTAVVDARPVSTVGTALVITLGMWVTLSTIRPRRWARLRRTHVEMSVLRDGRLPAAVTVVAIALSIVVIAI